MKKIANEGKKIAISTRIRLARNLNGYPFAGRMSDNQRKEVVERTETAFMNGDDNIHGDFEFVDMNNLSNLEATALVEQHLISPGFAAEKNNRGLLVHKNKDVSIMINEEDHLRIQAMTKGLALSEALVTADRIDDLFDEKLDYAFDEKLGFLTYCPTNLGTGMRASVMLHLPALVLTRTIGKVVNAVSKFGLAVRGFYGEGSEVEGDIYQISNQISLGVSEEQTISKLRDIVMQIIAKESSARALLNNNIKFELEDRIFRAYGILTQARILSVQEFLKHFSMVRLGIGLEFIKDISLDKVDEILTKAQNANISLSNGKELPNGERDIARAKFVREGLSS